MSGCIQKTSKSSKYCVNVFITFAIHLTDNYNNLNNLSLQENFTIPINKNFYNFFYYLR